MERRSLLRLLGFVPVAPAIIRSMIVDDAVEMFQEIAQDISDVEESIQKTIGGESLLNLYHKGKLFATGEDAHLFIKSETVDITQYGDNFINSVNGIKYAYLNFTGLSSLTKAHDLFEAGDKIHFKIVHDGMFLSGFGYFIELDLTCPGINKALKINGKIQVSGAVHRS